MQQRSEDLWGGNTMVEALSAAIALTVSSSANAAPAAAAAAAREPVRPRQLAFGADHFSAALAFGFGLAGNGAHHHVIQVHMFDRSN